MVTAKQIGEGIVAALALGLLLFEILAAMVVFDPADRSSVVRASALGADEVAGSNPAGPTIPEPR